ncbi:MAG: hypothetical protein LBR76_03005 [Oscillospiraceae bacterium]|nr:hypothetical protein [Oscillospiraceae bacterium]
MSLTSKTYFSRGKLPLSSMSAMPFAPRRTQRLNCSFHSSSSAQAVASGRWAKIIIWSWNGYL